MKRDYRIAVLAAVVVGILFALTETALLSMSKNAHYGNDPRVGMNTR